MYSILKKQKEKKYFSHIASQNTVMFTAVQNKLFLVFIVYLSV